MAYNRVNWKNKDEGVTPLNATNLNVMDQGIAQLDAKMSVVEQYARPASYTQIGAVRPDGKTIQIDGNGNIGAVVKKATYSQAGAVIPDGKTIQIDRNGKIVAIGGGGGTGGGDMYKSIYDSDDDGIVDAANCLQDGEYEVSASVICNALEDGFISRNEYDKNASGHGVSGSSYIIYGTNGNDNNKAEPLPKGQHTISYKYNGTGNTFLYVYSVNKGTRIVSGDNSNPLTFNLDSDDKVCVWIYINTSDSQNVYDVQVEKGSKATTYTEYAKSNVEITEELDDIQVQLTNKIGIKDVGMTISTEANPDGGFYYKVVDVSSYIPSNSKLISVGVSNWSGGEEMHIKDDKAFLFTRPNSVSNVYRSFRLVYCIFLNKGENIMDNVKYLLNRTKFLANGGVKTLEPSVHNDLMSAQAKYHRNIGTDMDDTTLSGSVSVITDTEGMWHDHFKWGEIIDKPIEG